VKIRSLSIYANYLCGHSGACCTSGWPIPVERETYARLQDALADGRMHVPELRPGTGPDLKVGAYETRHGTEARNGDRAPDGAAARFVTSAEAPVETPVLTAIDEHGACAFYERGRRRCAIHRQMGEGLLPVACRQFPRVSLLDARGLSVSLSHFCPTAAALLFEEGQLTVAEMPPAFPSDFSYDPLDAREALPPLLRPTLLLDLPTFAAWEREVVRLCGEPGCAAEDAVRRVVAFTEALRQWKPGRETAGEAVAAAIGEARATPPGEQHAFDAVRAIEQHALALGAVPAGLTAPGTFHGGEAARLDARFVADRWPLFASPLRRYLAAKAFGSWLAYQGRGLRTLVALLTVALSSVRLHAGGECARHETPLDRNALVAAIRATDELLVHLASRQALANALGVAEGALAAPGPLDVP
jgi:hypothetical protein